MHSTDHLDDGYMGSGKHLRHSINKYGVEKHICEKTEFFKTRKELSERETILVNEELLQDPLCMNLMVGGNGGKISDEQQQNRSSKGGRAYAKRLKTDLEFREKIFKTLSKGGTNLHKRIKEDTEFRMMYSKKISEAVSNRTWITNGENCRRIKESEEIPDGWYKGRAKWKLKS